MFNFWKNKLESIKHTTYKERKIQFFQKMQKYLLPRTQGKRKGSGNKPQWFSLIWEGALPHCPELQQGKYQLSVEIVDYLVWWQWVKKQHTMIICQYWLNFSIYMYMTITSINISYSLKVIFCMWVYVVSNLSVWLQWSMHSYNTNRFFMI